ncbi:hypothetical protein MMC07_007981 [Pseudocyphellaria aurata]|nr:hypothetical protein [Pseudocyphellaria aurata]
MTTLLEFVLNQGAQFRRARLPSLYSDFSLQRSTNPDGYAANIAAWEDVLIKANGAGLIPAGPDGRNFLSLRTGEELLQSLETREFGRPLALGTVIDEAVSHQHLIPVNEFLHNTASIYDQGWFVRPKWLRLWPSLWLGTTSTKLPDGRYVILETVEKAATQILSHVGQGTPQIDRVYTMSMFRKNLARTLNYKIEIVKFLAPNEINSSISAEERTVASLKSLIGDLNQQVELLMSQATTLVAESKMAIKKQNRLIALRMLRSKKMTEDNLKQRLETLETLEGILAKIGQASDQVAIVHAIKNSTGVLRKLNAQMGEIDKVEGVMEELQDEMKTVDQAGEILKDAGRDTEIDDDAIDEELESLAQQIRIEEERKGARETQEKLATINVPSNSTVSNGLNATNVSGSGQASFTGPEERADSLVTESTDAFVRMSLDEPKDPVVKNDTTQQRPTQVESVPIAEG